MSDVVKVEKVDCLNRLSIPLDGETIADDFEIEAMAPLIKEMLVYYRSEEERPFNRGNWIVDVRLKNMYLFSIRLPQEMEEKHIENYVAPLAEILRKLHEDTR